MRNSAIDVVKFIALVCMFLAHLRFIFPQYYFELLVVGRWVFILFAFVLAYNLSKILALPDLTRLKTYVFYLIVFAFLSEGPHSLMVGLDNSLRIGPWFPVQHNILYTYLFGLITVLVFSFTRNIFFKVLVTVAFLSILSTFSKKLEYGLPGIVLILAFYAYLTTFSRFKYLYLLLALYCSIFATAQYYDALDPLLLLSIFFAFTFVVLFSRLNLYFYVPKMGKWFYLFYPVHMGLIYVIGS